MKVLVTRPQGGAFFFFITKGFLNAFNDAGIDARYWDGNVKTFKDFDPDLYIGCSGHRQEAPKSDKLKIAVHVNPYGVKLEPLFGVDINEPNHAINWTVSQDPDVVFGYGLQEDGSTFWRDWTAKHNIPFVGVPTAGDATLYYPGPKRDDYKVAFLGGRWGYKGNNINKWLVPTIHKLGNKINIKGWGGWEGIQQYSGVLPENDSGREFLGSALVGPCVCEPHTTKYGIDVPERFFKVALCGSLPILDEVAWFDRYCDNYIMARNPEDYYNKIANYACNPDFIEEGKEAALLIRKEVLQKHTYHHRMRSLCASLGFDEAVDKFNDRISSFTD